jgi:hypothetical protein
MVLTVALAVSLAASSEKPRLLLHDLQASQDSDPALAQAMTSSVAAELNRRGVHDLVTSADVTTMLGAERQRQLMGCGDESTSCMAELSDALGARFIMTGALTRIGSAWQLTLQTVNGSNARSIGRAVMLAGDVETLMRSLPLLVADATGLERPIEPSRVGPSLLTGTGVAVMVAGGVVLLDSLFKENSLSRELELAQSTPSLLRPVGSYEGDGRLIVTQRTVAGIALGVGAALTTAGLVWLGSLGSHASVAVAPLPGGAAVALGGNWP